MVLMKFSMNRKERFAAFACLCMLMLTASCTNLTAVREWSRTSLEASQFNGIVATYVDTPVRLKRYDKLRFEQYRRPTGEQKRMFSLRQGLYDTNVTERRNQAEALKQILSVVSDYILISRTNYDEAMSGTSILSSLRISLCALVSSVSMCPYLPV